VIYLSLMIGANKADGANRGKAKKPIGDVRVVETAGRVRPFFLCQTRQLLRLIPRKSTAQW
jgi:hypothetical protein